MLTGLIPASGALWLFFSSMVRDVVPKQQQIMNCMKIFCGSLSMRAYKLVCVLFIGFVQILQYESGKKLYICTSKKNLTKLYLLIILPFFFLHKPFAQYKSSCLNKFSRIQCHFSFCCYQPCRQTLWGLLHLLPRIYSGVCQRYTRHWLEKQR